MKRLFPRQPFLATLLFSLFLLAPALVAQNPWGALEGVVQDESGARIQSARIVVVSTASPVTREATTNSRGEFRLEALPPGNYQMTVNATGFAEARTWTLVSLGEVHEISVKLKPAATQQTVTVQGQASSITAGP